MFVGGLILCLGAIALWPLERWTHEHLHGLSHQLAERVYLPWARAGLIVLFLISVYPKPLLAPQAGPADTMLLAPPAPDSLLNGVFFAGLLLPLLPLTRQLSGLILSVQTLIGAGLLIGAFQRGSGIHLHSSWGILQFGAWLGLILGSHLLLHALANRLHQRWPEQPPWSDSLSLYDGLALMTQPPLILLFSRSLQGS